jgi:hypothetical protein
MDINFFGHLPLPWLVAVVAVVTIVVAVEVEAVCAEKQT